MKTICGYLAPLCLLASLASAQPNPAPEGIPVSPIPNVTRFGHPTALVISNQLLEVTVLPGVGRIAGLRFGGLDNVVRFDGALAEAAALGTAHDGWRNYGGDWLFVSPQANWERLFGHRWPPPAFLDGLPWTGHAWASDDGSQNILMQLEVGAPLNARIQRQLRLDPALAQLTIRQRIERTAPSDIPLTLWNISQIPGARRVLLPVDEDSMFADGYSILDFGPPAPHLLTRAQGGVLLLDTLNGTEHKLGSDSPRGWIAAQRGDVLIIERATTLEPGGDFPDGGCRVELYANHGLGYTEIETLSEERMLAPGEILENTLTFSFHHVKANLDDEALARRTLEILGESPPVPKP